MRLGRPGSWVPSVGDRGTRIWCCHFPLWRGCEDINDLALPLSYLVRLWNYTSNLVLSPPYAGDYFGTTSNLVVSLPSVGDCGTTKDLVLPLTCVGRLWNWNLVLPLSSVKGLWIYQQFDAATDLCGGICGTTSNSALCVFVW